MIDPSKISMDEQSKKTKYPSDRVKPSDDYSVSSNLDFIPRKRGRP